MKKFSTALIVVFFSAVLAFADGFYNSTEFKQADVNPFDQALMNPYSKALDYTGTAFEICTLLTPSVMFAAEPADYWKIGLSYGETLLLTYGTTKLLKFAVGRARPYMYFEGAPESAIADGDWNSSFPSGHASRSFAAASFLTFTFCQYFPESKWKIPVIAGSYALALTTSCLRIASGNHFATDVLTGAAIGTVIGFAVPWLNSLWLKPVTNRKDVDVAILPAGVMVSLKF